MKDVTNIGFVASVGRNVHSIVRCDGFCSGFGFGFVTVSSSAVATIAAAISVTISVAITIAIFVRILCIVLPETRCSDVVHDQ